VKLLLLADLHLDAAFQWAGARVARVRRQHLRDVLAKAVDLAREQDVDAFLVAGDLYEHERLAPDTENAVRRAFERLHPIRVFVAPGNHDWLGPASLWQRAAFTPNVHVFESDRLEPVALDDGLTLWGAAHRAPANTDGFLERFARVDRGGVHLALFHGAERSSLAAQGSGKAPHAPFSPDQIERAGIHHAFVGHYHRPADAERFTYPGNPDPLAFGEDGVRGVVVATVGADGRVARERHKIGASDVHDVEVDVTGCASEQEVRARVNAALSGRGGVARVTLRGELRPEIDLALSDFAEPPKIDALRVCAGAALRFAYDFDGIARERTVRGQFVREVRDSDLPEDEKRRVLVTGLRALDGRDDLEVL
jgi:DNA repair exonuclease SbcCD nuclease subunit